MMRIENTQRAKIVSATVTAAEHVIEKFGGLTKLARALDCAVSTVQGWKERGRIPQEHWLSIIDAGRASDIDLSLEEFVIAPTTGEAA